MPENDTNNGEAHEHNMICYSKCPEVKRCVHLDKHEDKPTKFANLGYRAIFAFVSWILLLSAANDGNGYFIAQAMLCVPIFKDFIEYAPFDRGRRVLRLIAMWLCVLCLAFSIAGIMGVIVVTFKEDLAYFTIKKNSIFHASWSVRLFYSWIAVGMLFGSTLIDWFCGKTTEEKIFLDQMPQAL